MQSPVGTVGRPTRSQPSYRTATLVVVARGSPHGNASATRSRGPYVKQALNGGKRHGPPSEALATNIRDYRVLRHITQDDLAARMNQLGHGWGRSTVSAVEGSGRNVTTDELFGLAIVFAVTIGQLLDPTGPDHSRNLSLDVGIVTSGGHPGLIQPVCGQLWGASRAVVRQNDGGWEFDIDVADDHLLAALRSV